MNKKSIYQTLESGFGSRYRSSQVDEMPNTYGTPQTAAQYFKSHPYVIVCISVSYPSVVAVGYTTRKQAESDSNLMFGHVSQVLTYRDAISKGYLI